MELLIVDGGQNLWLYRNNIEIATVSLLKFTDNYDIDDVNIRTYTDRKFIIFTGYGILLLDVSKIPETKDIYRISEELKILQPLDEYTRKADTNVYEIWASHPANNGDFIYGDTQTGNAYLLYVTSDGYNLQLLPNINHKNNIIFPAQLDYKITDIAYKKDNKFINLNGEVLYQLMKNSKPISYIPQKLLIYQTANFHLNFVDLNDKFHKSIDTEDFYISLDDNNLSIYTFNKGDINLFYWESDELKEVLLSTFDLEKDIKNIVATPIGYAIKSYSKIYILDEINNEYHIFPGYNIAMSYDLYKENVHETSNEVLNDVIAIHGVQNIIAEYS